MTAVTRTLQEQAFEPLECTIPEELTIAEYRTRRAGAVSARKPDRRSPKLSFRSLIRR